MSAVTDTAADLPQPDMTNYNAATKDLSLTPQEQYLYQHHLNNLNPQSGVSQNPGELSTIYAWMPKRDGKSYVVPSVWDGKITPIPDEQKVYDKLDKVGWDKFPSYGSYEEANARYAKMHDYMEKDTESYLQKRRGLTAEDDPKKLADPQYETKSMYERAHDALSSFFAGSHKFEDPWTPKDPDIYKEYPSGRDIENAQTKNAFYNKPYESYTRPGQAVISKPQFDTLPNTASDMYKNYDKTHEAGLKSNDPLDASDMAREGLTVNRSSVASLGFDPRYPVLTGRAVYGDSSGEYLRDMKDKELGMWASDTPGTLTHESLHRGINSLRNSKELPNGMPGPEEHIVRRMMQRIMGDPEKDRRPPELTKALADPKYVQQLDDYITKIEKIAADKHAKDNPRGPR